MINLFVINPTTSDEIELPFLTLTISEELNVGKDCRIQLDFFSIKEVAEKYNSNVLFILTSGIRRIRVEKDGTSIFLGVVTDFNIQENDAGRKIIDLYSVGLFNLLAKRRTNAKRVFIQDDAGDIAWTLIDESQLSDPPYSDLGITQGSITTSVDRDRTFRFANLKEEITKMSNNNLRNGFDFEVDNTGKFNVFYPTKGSQRPNIFLDDQNILNWGVRKPLIMTLTNKVYVLGEGFNDDILYTTRQSSNSYKTTFGLLEEVLSAREIITTETLNDKGDKFLADYQSPILTISLNHNDADLNILDYEVGDSIRVTIETMEIEAVYKRIYKRILKIDTNEHTLVTLDVK